MRFKRQVQKKESEYAGLILVISYAIAIGITLVVISSFAQCIAYFIALFCLNNNI